jgi:hypothetical protein
MKKRVKFLDSWAHLADPNVKALDAKYQLLRDQNAAKPENQQLKPSTINFQIAEMKKADRYAEKPVGFGRDISFKAGDETELPEQLAYKLEEAGIVTSLADQKKAA